jgi:4-hydroxybutyrate dehydrogenase / sulfolactaldehyde 3-reductase
MLVGFVGLGAMGLPMALRLVEAGHPLGVVNRPSHAASELARRGARIFDTPAELARESRVVFTMLRDFAELDRVLFGEHGVVEAAPPQMLVVNMSTIGRSDTERMGSALAASQLRMLDVPVGRGPAYARRGQLVLLVGGAEADIEEAEPLLRVLGDDLVRCGALGAGSAMKVVNNLLSCASLVATAEALALGVRSGLSIDVVLHVLGSTAARNVHVETTFKDKVLRGDLTPGFALELANKDLGLALSMGSEAGIQLALGAAARQLLTQACARGDGRLDWTAILRVLGEFASTDATTATRSD